MYVAKLEHPSASKRILSVVECYKTVFGLNGLDLDDYFEFCRSKNTRANHPFKIQTKLAKVKLSTPSSWASSKNGTVCQTISSTGEINLNRFSKAWKEGWRFIDTEAYILIVYIFILNTIFTYCFVPALMIFRRVFYNFLIFLKFSYRDNLAVHLFKYVSCIRFMSIPYLFE